MEDRELGEFLKLFRPLLEGWIGDGGTVPPGVSDWIWGPLKKRRSIRGRPGVLGAGAVHVSR